MISPASLRQRIDIGRRGRLRAEPGEKTSPIAATPSAIADCAVVRNSPAADLVRFLGQLTHDALLFDGMLLARFQARRIRDLVRPLFRVIDMTASTARSG
jgi:hypothetical protein